MTVRRSIPVVLAASLAALACTDPTGPLIEPIDELPRPLTAEEQKLVQASNRFAFDFFRQINTAQRGSNVFVSPLSASVALGMTMNGAGGETWEAMRTGLRLGDAQQSEINEGYRSLTALLLGLDRSTDMRIANSIWFRHDFPFHQSFLDESKLYFDARVQGLDFDSPAAVQTINSWVSSATNQRIPTIIEFIDPDEVMFLINAIYFKGAWQQPFNRSRTQNASFHALDGTTSTVPLMHRPAAEQVRWAQGSGFTAVDHRYGNSAFTMTIVLPDTDRDVNEVAESLTPASWAALTEAFHDRAIDFYLPRFRLEWERRLNSDLIALGMGPAFWEGLAPGQRPDFTRLSPGGDELAITRVIQKTFVEVNEEGTEAAAVTLVSMGVTSVPPAFRVDRPFIFVIRERFSGTILFMGKIAKLPV